MMALVSLLSGLGVMLCITVLIIISLIAVTAIMHGRSRWPL